MMFWPLLTSALLLLAAWLVSNHYPPWVTAHSELLAALALVVMWLAALAAGRRQRIALPMSSLFLLALATVPLLQTLGGPIFFFGDGWIASLYLMATALAVLASAHAAKFTGPALATGGAATLLTAALLSSAIAWLQRFEIDAGPLALHIAAVKPGHAPFANLAQPNQLASLLALGMAGLWFLFEQGRIARRWAVALALLLSVSLAMTQSRTPVLLFAVAALALWLAQRRWAVRTRAWVVPALAGIWALAFMAWPRVIESVHLAPGSSMAKRMQAGPRTVIWSQLWDALWLRPWTGFGWNQVSVAQVAVAADHPLSRYVEHSHNLLLDLLLWNGVPLGLLMIGVSGSWLWRRVRDVRDPQGLFGLLVVGLLLAHAMVEFPLDYLYFLVPFGVALGLVEASRPSRAPGLSMPATAGWATAVVFFGVTAWAAVDYWRVEDAYREMRFTVARVGRPMVTEPPPLLATQFTQLAAFHRYALSTPHPGMSAQEVDWMRKVAHRYAYAPSLYRYALAQAWSGDVEGAKLTLRQMRQLHGERPHNAAQRELREMVQGEHPELRGLLLAP